MAPIKNSIEIARSQDDVFAYLDQLERHNEWQEQVVSSTRDTDGPSDTVNRLRGLGPPSTGRGA